MEKVGVVDELDLLALADRDHVTVELHLLHADQVRTPRQRLIAGKSGRQGTQHNERNRQHEPRYHNQNLHRPTPTTPPNPVSVRPR